MVKENGRWVRVSRADFMAAVEEMFFGLRALGIRAGDRVAIISENRIEWTIADHAIAASAAASVPIYPTSSAPQMEYLLRDSGASMALVSDATQLDKVTSVRRRLPDMRYIVVFDKGVHRPGAIRLDSILRIGRRTAHDAPNEFRRAAAAVQPGDLATII
jgi:long-chain acyl-CoA synthetase